MKPSLYFLILLFTLALPFNPQAAASSIPPRPAQSAAAISPTLTPTLPVPTPTAATSQTSPTEQKQGFRSIQKCIPVEEKLPAEINPGNELLLREPYRERVYDFKVGIDRMSPYPANTGDLVSSPDRKWMAYTAEGYMKTIRNHGHPPYDFFVHINILSSLKLEVQNAEGRKLDMSFWRVDWQYILGWLDNQHLVLSISKYPAGSVVILNPFSGEWKVITPSLPNIWKPDPDFRGDRPDVLAYNSLLTHTVYLPGSGDRSGSKGSLTLYNLETQKTLWRGSKAGWYNWYEPQPLWSPTGNQLVILDKHDQDLPNFLLVGADGSTQTIASGVQWGYRNLYSWSPDGRSVAAWMGHQEGQLSLSIADIENQTLTDFCLTIDRYGLWLDSPAPVWSPDGQFLAVKLRDQDEGFFNTVLVDVRLQRAFLFRKNATPLDWMKKP